jgi:hypothetical protein
MRIFARWIKPALDVTVQCPQDADARHHGRPAMFCNQQQRLHRGLPWLGVVFDLGEFGDVLAPRRGA